MSYKHLFLTLALMTLPFAASAGWVQQEEGSLQAIRALDAFEGMIMAAGNSGYRMYSEDGGETWVVPEKTASNWWYDMEVTTDKVYLVGASGGYATSEDGGITWQSASIGATANLYDIEMSDTYGYIGGASGTAYYYANNNWNTLGTGITKDINAVQDMGDATGWAVTSEGWLYYITSGGLGWTEIGKVANEHLNDVYFSSSSEGWILGDSGTLRYTSDTGSSWTNIEIEGVITQDLYSVAVDGNEMVIAGEEILLRSIDAGETWSVTDFSSEGYEFHVAHVDADGQFWVAGTDDDVTSIIYKMSSQAPDAPSSVGYWTTLDDGEDTLEFYWSDAEDVDSTELTYYISLDGADVFSVGTETEYTWEDVTVGEHTFVVYAVDEDGNVGEEQDMEFTYEGDSTEEEIESEAEGDSLIKMTCSEDIEVNDPCKAVYYYANDGTRHAFPNEKVFFTWYDDFDEVTEVSAEFLASLSLGTNVTYKPGATMVKFQSVPTVYVVSHPATLQSVASEEVAEGLYGENWNQYIHDISDAFVGNYSFGEEIESADAYDADVQAALASSLSDIF